MSKERLSLGLPAKSVVGRYQLNSLHSCWGFYITYLAEVDGTARQAMVHELVPEELVERAPDGSIQGKSGKDKEDFAWARERFLSEGRALAACSHPAIQKVLEVFEANNTAYWVTATDEPRDLKVWLERFGRAPTEAELAGLLRPLLSALEQLHAAGLCHLNLKFDTIRITADGQPILIHFAGARQDIARRSHGAGAATRGYSPIEQYDDAKPEGPWTDIYSLAAVLHRLIAGQLPPEATARLTSDPYQKLAARFSGKYRTEFLSALDAALAPDPTARPQSIVGWRKMLGIPATDTAGWRSKPALVRICAAVLLAVIAAGGWYLFRPKPVPLIIVHDDHKDQKKKDEEQKKAEEEKKKAEQAKKAEEEKKAEEARAAEEKRKAEKQKLAEAEKKAEEDQKAAEKAAEGKAAAAKQADEAAKEKADATRTAAEKAESESGDAAQAASKAGEAKGAARKKAAEKAAADAFEKAAQARSEADQAAAESAAANVAAKQAELDEASAEKTAAEKDLAQKAIEQQIAALAADPKSADAKTAADQAAAAKAAAEKNVAEKTAAEKAAAEKLAAAVAAQKSLDAKKVSGDNPSKEKSDAEKAAEEKAAAEKAAAEKATAEKAAAEKAEAEKAAAEKAAAEMAAKKAAEEKAAADKVAADKAAELAKKQQDNSSQNQSGPPPPPSGGSAGQVGSGLGGVWETIQKDANGKPLKRLIIYPDTHFELTTDSGTITGIIRAKLGIISLEPDNSKDAFPSTFVYKSMSVIETDGVLGKLEWTRISASTPERDQRKAK
ncbi:MAG TPA: hypothetical protein VGM54_21765 [Chthoniobacter sp.]|jgi:hypothetical protein